MEAPPDDDCCPVCRGQFKLPCRTSCSHWYCGECILSVWLHRDAMKRCRCPICCCQFSSLAPFQAAFDYNYEPEAQKIMENVRRYNRLHMGGVQGLIQKLYYLPFLVRMALQDMMDPDKTSTYLCKVRIFAMILGLIYMLIPLDIIPYDKRHILSLFDHSAVAFVTIMHIIGLLRSRRFRG
ncbi:hypothetical protein L6164_036203 [Bauhinia variegata]|uniref:Uncharacterized protein n=1 Tax=Bauhinia variegata TaxID=167791 RepID=A0ACB9KG72_BAUVA|nr:hypothetical protein L6164_036203 [Bauhinia variegata]